MTGYDRHASADELASLAVGDLRRGRAAKITAHLGGCDQCSAVSRRLGEVPAILAGASYPSIPEHLSARIETALSTEATQRLSAMPATEQGRRALPARRLRRAGRPALRVPGLSVVASRLVAAAGAVVILAFGGYEAATHLGGGSTTAPSTGSAAAPAPVQQMSLGPDVTYGSPGSLHTIETVRSSANFVPARLSTLAVSAVHAAEAKGASAAQPSASTPGPSSAPTTSRAGSAGPSSATASRLAGCVTLIAAGRTLLLVDIAKYDGHPATIIVAAAVAGQPAEVWAVGSSCTATNKDLLGHATLSNL